MACRNCFCPECRERYGRPEDPARTGERATDPAPPEAQRAHIDQIRQRLRGDTR